ncbi:hypothetical protein [Streptomyces sp. NPDC046859]|uniref:hypothetical protein n=1 Tax=Streptomyces sp. NPDC046859 TaxID=3155734 RepID=UPI00340D0284
MPTSPTSPPSDEPAAGEPRPPGRLRRAATALRRGLRAAGPPRRKCERELEQCRQERDRWQRYADSYERDLTRVRLERAQLLAWLAALHPASAVLTRGADGIHQLGIEAGGRQLSWPLHPADLPQFAHIPYAPHTVGPYGRAIGDQAAHLRRHTRLLAMEGMLFATTRDDR